MTNAPAIDGWVDSICGMTVTAHDTSYPLEIEADRTSPAGSTT